EDRRRRGHGERRDERRAGARGRRAGERDRRGGAPPDVLDAGEDAVGPGRRRDRRPRAALRGRRRGHPPGLAHPALARPGRARAREPARHAPRVPRRRPGRRGRPRLRVLGRRLLGRPEGPRGRRGVADPGHPHLLLLAPQGRHGAGARRDRAVAPPPARRPPAARSDLQARGGVGDPALLRRPLPALAAAAPGPAAGRPRRPAAALPGRPLARRGRRLPARRPVGRRARRLQRRRGAGPRSRDARRGARRAAGARPGPRAARRRRRELEGAAAADAPRLARPRPRRPDHGHHARADGARVDAEAHVDGGAARAHRGDARLRGPRHAAAQPVDERAAARARAAHRRRPRQPM
ncbi:MAG: Nucleoside-diphosphate-sugar epimerases, partial [uncultured Solirubrobacteraceae bacterium]